MKAENKDLFKFMRQTSNLIIPVYQRNYDWKKQNCHQLFVDIENIADSDKKTHFIGTICTQSGVRHSSIIIDGQQRITSIMLLLKAICHNTDKLSLKEDIEYDFLFNRSKDKDTKVKLKPIKKDEGVFCKLVNMDELEDDEFTIEEKQSNIYQNYQYFSELVKKTDIDLQKLTNAILRLEIVELEVEYENPQIIFEGLNSTGLDLTNTDLLRNYLLMSLDYSVQEKFYLKYWLEMEEMIGSDNMERFMLYYLVMNKKSSSIFKDDKNAKININNLYYAFKKTYPNINDLKSEDHVESRLKDMLKYAKIYKEFIKQTPHSTGKLQKRFYELFTQLEAYDSSIFLMPLYEKYKNHEINEPTLIAIVDILITYTFRSKVCRKYGMNTQTAALSIRRLEAMENDPKHIIEKIYEALMMNKGSYAFPKDSEFKNELIHKDIYKSLKSIGCKYLLGKIERHLTKESVDVQDASIEHIIPQTLTKDWVEYLNKNDDMSNYDIYLHTLGNLALTKYNSELSNDTFEDKKKIYQNSNFIYTKRISEYPEFTSQEITERAHKLAEIALSVWNLPPKYNRTISATNATTYNLDSDFNEFASTKPDIVGMFGEEFKVSHWKDFWIKFNEMLYKQDKVQYLKLAKLDWLNKPEIVSTQKDYRFNYELEENTYYLDTVFSTYTLLYLMNEIITKVDAINGSNLRDEIWLTIKKSKQ